MKMLEGLIIFQQKIAERHHTMVIPCTLNDVRDAECFPIPENCLLDDCEKLLNDFWLWLGAFKVVDEEVRPISFELIDATDKLFLEVPNLLS